MRLAFVSAAIAAAIAAGPAHAGEIFAGIYAHDIDTPLSLSGQENGADVALGWRGGRIGRTPLQPYVFGALNTAGNASYAAAGISAKFGDRIFIRPGLGVAIHNGSAANFDDPFDDEVEFGSRVLFEPELGVGARISSRATIEASWVHLSHAQVFGRENPGMDNIGVRLSFGL
jgi:hypothetical protein